MSKVLLTIGAGPGISAATARKFGANGYKVALVSLKQEESEKEKAALAALGVEAIALQADAADAAAVKKAIEATKEKLGPVTAVHYNAFALSGSDDAAAFINCCAVGCTGLLTVKKELLADLKAQKGAILVTSSVVASTGLPAEVEEFVAGLGLEGYCAGKAAQDRLTTQMAITLGKEGVFVGKVVVAVRAARTRALPAPIAAALTELVAVATGQSQGHCVRPGRC